LRLAWARRGRAAELWARAPAPDAGPASEPEAQRERALPPAAAAEMTARKNAAPEQPRRALAQGAHPRAAPHALMT